MFMQRTLLTLLMLAIILGTVPRGEAAWYCRTTDRRVAECCCKAAPDPCATESNNSACSCCDLEFSVDESGGHEAPLTPRAALERPDTNAVGSLLAPGLADFPPSVVRVHSDAAAPRLPSDPPLYLLHRVFRC